MKKAILIALLGFTIATYATGQTQKTATNIEKLATLDVNKKQARDMFGEPKEIMVVKGNTRWIYRNKTRYIKLEWNDETASLKKFTYSTINEVQPKWDVDFTTTLEIEKTTVNNVINKLGNPTELVVNNNNQRIIYKYNDRNLLLQFKEGLLEKYVLTRT